MQIINTILLSLTMATGLLASFHCNPERCSYGFECINHKCELTKRPDRRAYLDCNQHPCPEGFECIVPENNSLHRAECVMIQHNE